MWTMDEAGGTGIKALPNVIITIFYPHANLAASGLDHFDYEKLPVPF